MPFIISAPASPRLQAKSELDLPPSSFLPPLKSEPSYVQLQDVITRLSILYADKLTWDDSELITEDLFEKKSSIAYLTRLIGTGCPWIEESDDILAIASSLLASLCGRAASGPIERHYNINGDDIVLTDTTFVENDVGFKTWGAAYLLAKRLNSETLRGKRVLEIGSGTGLAGIYASRFTHVVLSDYLDRCLDNLRHNAKVNEADVKVHKLDWEEIANGHLSAFARNHAKSFDVIIASDIVYEIAHIQWIHATLKHFLAPDGKALFESPLRPTHTKDITAFEKAMERDFTCIAREEETGRDDWHVDLMYRYYEFRLE